VKKGLLPWSASARAMVKGRNSSEPTPQKIPEASHLSMKKPLSYRFSGFFN
jgi:hypothetical protein